MEPYNLGVLTIHATRSHSGVHCHYLYNMWLFVEFLLKIHSKKLEYCKYLFKVTVANFGLTNIITRQAPSQKELFWTNHWSCWNSIGICSFTLDTLSLSSIVNNSQIPPWLKNTSLTINSQVSLSLDCRRCLDSSELHVYQQ